MSNAHKVTIGNATLYLGDCMEIMPTIASVDAVITDPPYSANTHKQAKTNKGNGRGVKLVTFSAIDDVGFVKLADELLRVANGWVVSTCDYRHAALMYEDRRFIRLGAWVKPNPMPQISGDRPGQGFETVLIMHAGKVAKCWNRGGGSGVWTFATHGCGTEVPTQKPIGLLCALVSDFTKTGQTILDCCMGSGTTGIAALQLGRKFIGIEKDPKHFAIACERIKAAHAQHQLFDHAETLGEVPKTASLFDGAA